QQLRVRHLPAIRAPMLFVQGERDAFGTPDELRPVIGALAAPAELHVVAGGDHSFKVPKKLGVPQESVYEQVLDRIAQGLRELWGPSCEIPRPEPEGGAIGPPLASRYKRERGDGAATTRRGNCRDGRTRMGDARCVGPGVGRIVLLQRRSGARAAVA